MAAFFAVMSLELVLTKNLPIAFWIPSMFGSVAIMYMFLISSWNISFYAAGYYCVRSFVLSEFAASLEWQLYYFLITNGMSKDPVVEFIFVAVVFSVVFVAAYLIERKTSIGEKRIVIRTKELLSVVFIGIAVFTTSNIGMISSSTPFSGLVALGIYNTRTFVDLSGVVILYAFQILQLESSARNELNAIQLVLQRQYAQYKQSRDSIELINLKYHDLKHQINAMRMETDEERREAWLDAMESDISSYEAQNKTGNRVLDTVLTEKSLYCQKHSITLTCVADGSVIQFMDVIDVCTIFGNALDNAINAVLRVAQKDRRLIHLTVTNQKNFVLIQIENYFEGELKYNDDNLISTKGDERFHGYGLKSIRYSADRYGGTMSIKAEDDWFNLRILIPIPSGDQAERTD